MNKILSKEKKFNQSEVAQVTIDQLKYRLIKYSHSSIYAIYSQLFFNARHPLMQKQNLVFKVIIGLNILYEKSLYNREIFH